MVDANMKWTVDEAIRRARAFAPCDLAWLEAHGFGLDRFIAEPMRLVEGNAIAPERPGHGIVFDWAGLSRHVG